MHAKTAYGVKHVLKKKGNTILHILSNGKIRTKGEKNSILIN